jgi:hypothetical protein
LEEKAKVDEGSESKYSAGGMFYAFFMDIPGLFQTFSYGGSFYITHCLDLTFLDAAIDKSLKIL